MNIDRFDIFQRISLVIVLGLVVLVARHWSGADLGLEVNPYGYIDRVPTALAEEYKGSSGETIQRSDRLLTIAGRRVGSLAEMEDVLNQLQVTVEEPASEENPDPQPEALRVPLLLERVDYLYEETLTYAVVEAQGLPARVEEGDKVVKFGGREVSGMDRGTILGMLARQRGDAVSITFRRPVHQYTVEVPLQHPQWPTMLWPIMLFALAATATVAVSWVARWSRSPLGEEDQGLRAMWLRFALTSLAAPWALMLLSDTSATLRDPVLLLPAMLALALFRPLCLDMHWRLQGGVDRTAVAAIIYLPAVVTALTGLLIGLALVVTVWGNDTEFWMGVWGLEGASGTGWGGPGGGWVIQYLQVASAVLAIYHVVDLVLWFREGAVPPGGDGLAWLGVGFGLVMASVVLLAALLFELKALEDFANGGFLTYTAGMVMALWVGDMTLLVWPPGALPDRSGAPRDMTAEESRMQIAGFLDHVCAHMGVKTAELVVVHNRLALVMHSDGLSEETHLVVERAPEPLRAAVGVLRDEQLTLPLAPHRDQGRGEHQGETRLADEVARSVVDTLDVQVAFCLLDEADNLLSPSHDARQRAFYVYVIVRGEEGDVGGPEGFTALRRAFAHVWPQTRQLLLDHLLAEAGEGHEGVREAAEALTVAVEADVSAADPDTPPEPEDSALDGLSSSDPEAETSSPDLRSSDPHVSDGESLDEGPSDIGALETPSPGPGSVSSSAPGASAAAHLSTRAGGGSKAPVRTPAPPMEPTRLSPEVRELPFLRRDLAEAYPTHEPDLLEPWLERAVQDLAVLDAPVVVIGPPGSGKEFVARRIHALSDQGRGPFITFAASNCPPSLWALELFGDADAYGHMTAAVDGTLFVEDAGVLEDRLLDRLLRELPRQAGPVRLILSVRLSPTEAPEGFIQSAGGLLGELVRGLLANQRVVVPPLSERGAVLGRIVDHYMMQWAMKHNRVITSMAPATFDLLRRHPWPAGVTELKAILEAAVLRCDSQTLLPEHTGLTSTGTGSDGILVDLDELAQATGNLEALLMDVQAAVYLEAYNREQGNKTAAARLVGVKRSTYVRRLKALLGEE